MRRVSTNHVTVDRAKAVAVKAGIAIQPRVIQTAHVQNAARMKHAAQNPTPKVVTHGRRGSAMATLHTKAGHAATNLVSTRRAVRSRATKVHVVTSLALLAHVTMLRVVMPQGIRAAHVMTAHAPMLRVQKAGEVMRRARTGNVSIAPAPNAQSVRHGLSVRIQKLAVRVRTLKGVNINRHGSATATPHTKVGHARTNRVMKISVRMAHVLKSRVTKAHVQTHRVAVAPRVALAVSPRAQELPLASATGAARSRRSFSSSATARRRLKAARSFE